MANYQNLLNTINGAIQTNGTGAITGQLLQTVLDGMVASLGAKYQYAGIATPATNPGTPDENVFYLAAQAGTYTNFGGLVVNDGEVCALKWDGAWAKDVTGAATAEQVSQLGQYVDNPEWVRVVTDANDRILYGVKTDGKFYFGGGCPPQVKTLIEEVVNVIQSELHQKASIEDLEQKVDKETGKSLIDETVAEMQSAIENPEFLKAVTDINGKIIYGVKTDGSFVFGEGCPQQIKDYISEIITTTLIESPEFMRVETDSQGMILSFINKDGTKIEKNKIRFADCSAYKFSAKQATIEDGDATLKTLCVSEDIELQSADDGDLVVLNGNVFVRYFNPYSEMNGMNKYKGNLHGHTTNSDGFHTPVEYMERYKNDGYDFATITDHDFVTPDPGVDGILFMGTSYEDSSPTQHINIYQIPEVLDYNEGRTANNVLIKGSYELKRMCCYNHPNYALQYQSDEKIASIKKILPLVEVWNGGLRSDMLGEDNPEQTWDTCCRAWDILLSNGHKVFGMAVDDYHNEYDYRKGYIEVYAKEKTVKDIWWAIAKGRFVACNCNKNNNSIIISNIEANEGKLKVVLGEPCDVYYFGESGTILQTDLNTSESTYAFTGDENYVRCAIKKGYEYKWLQPFIKKSVIQRVYLK